MITKIEQDIALKREKIANLIAKESLKQKYLDKLFYLSYLSITNSEPFYTNFNCEELIDAVFGSSVVLCGTNYKMLTTQILGKRAIYENKSALEFLLFLIIENFAKHSDKSFKIKAEINDNLKVVFSTEKRIKISKYIYKIAEILDANISVFNGEKTVLVINKKLKDSCENTTALKKDYEYIINPFSIAFIILRKVCVNPAFNNTFRNFNTVNRG